MASKRAEKALGWDGMTVQQTAQALLAAYRQRSAGSDVIDGVTWHRLEGANLSKLGMEISGQSSSRVYQAHSLLLHQGLRRSEGTGRTTLHWVRSGEPGLSVEEEVFVRAALKISQLTETVERLKAEKAELLARLHRQRSLNKTLRAGLKGVPALNALLHELLDQEE